MDKRYESIYFLLEKYYNGDTTASEERQLEEFFREEKNLPDDLIADKATFEAIRGSFDNIEVPEDLNSRILKAIDEHAEGKGRIPAATPKKAKRSFSVLLWAIPAAAAIAIIMLLPFIKNLDGDSVATGAMTADNSLSVKQEISVINTETEKQETPALSNRKSVEKPAYAKVVKSAKAEEDAQLTDEEIRALHRSMSILSKAGKQIAYVKERIDYTDRTVNNSFAEVKAMLRPGSAD